MNRRPVKLKTLALLGALLQLLTFAVHAERLPVKIYTSADGLGSGFINFALRDSRGFMWFCTRDGLSRFDGSRFVTYGLGNETSVPGMETIYEDRSGNYWISTTGGTYRFDPSQTSGADISGPRLAAEFVMPQRGQFFEDSRGNFWSNVFGFSRYTGRDGKHTFEKLDLKLPPQPGSGFHISDFAETSDGSVWLNTSWGLVRLLPDGRNVHYPVEYGGLYANPSMLADKSGRIWLAATDRILVFKPEETSSFGDEQGLLIRPFNAGSSIELKPGDHVPMPQASGEIIQFTNSDLNRFVEYSYAKRVFQTSDGDVWITAEDYLLEFSDNIYHLHTGAEGLPNVMARMAEDSAGNLWIAGQTGLARLDRGGLVTFGKPDGSNSDRFFSINEDTDGTVYFTGRDFYLSRFADGKLVTVRPAVEPNSNYLWTSRFSLRSSDGDWWMLTNRKLYRFAATDDFASLDRSQPKKIYTKADGLPGDAMFQIFEDSRGDIWVSTRTDDARGETGVARLRRGDEKFQTFGDADGLPAGKAFSAAAEDRAGNIWFSFYSGGAARYNGSKFEVFEENKNGLPLNTLPDVLVDQKGRMWIASATGGVIRVDDPAAATPTFTPVTTRDGLSSNNIRSLTEDKFGRIYLGTVRGVDRLSPDTGFIKHYSVDDGLAADFVVDAHTDKKGDLWFATNNGVSRLVPQPEEKIAAPQIFLGGLRIAGEHQKISQLGTFELDPGDLSASQNNLQIDFFGLDFRAGETLRYQYKLEGADEEWSPPTDLHTVTFANLQPGSYRFLVRAVNSEGAQSASPAAVRFTILRPIYARWWFVALCGLAAVGILLTIERYRAARHRELSVSEGRFRSLVEQSPFGIMILKPDGTIRSVNQAYLDIWGGGVTREQILTWDMRNDEQLLKSGVVEQIGRAFKGETVKGSPVLYDFNNSSIPLESSDATPRSAWLIGSVYPVKKADGELLEVIAVLEDVTARKTAEEGLARARLERLIELEQVRARIATDLHDDIGASLTQIAILSEVARQKTISSRSNGDSAPGPLDMIYSVSNDLVSTMSDIVWSINPQKDQLHDLTLRMRRFAADVLTARNIDLEFEAPDDLEDFPLNSNLRREVFLIFKESINNVVKHSGATEVDVRFWVDSDEIFLTVRDNGKGFTGKQSGSNGVSDIGSQTQNPQSYGGNGLGNMKRRAAEMGGEFEIASEPGSGCTVRLRLPVTIRLDSDIASKAD